MEESDVGIKKYVQKQDYTPSTKVQTLVRLNIKDCQYVADPRTSVHMVGKLRSTKRDSSSKKLNHSNTIYAVFNYTLTSDNSSVIS